MQHLFIESLELHGFETMLKSALKEYGKSKLKKDYASAVKAYNSAILMEKILQYGVSEASTSYRNFIKSNPPIPENERYSSVSDYGFAMEALGKYKRISAAVNLDGADFQALSRTAWGKPRKVDASVIPLWWKIKNNYQSMYNTLKKRVSALKDALAGASAAAVFDGRWAAVALAKTALQIAESKENTAEQNYEGALQTYNTYAHQLPYEQTLNNKWKKKMSSESTKIAADIEKKIQQTEQKEQKAEKKVEAQTRNIMSILKTFTAITSGKQGAVKTKSYM